MLGCQKKRLCSVMDQIILRYKKMFNFIVGVKSCTTKRQIFAVVSDRIFGHQNTVFPVRELASSEKLRTSKVLQ